MHQMSNLEEWRPKSYVHPRLSGPVTHLVCGARFQNRIRAPAHVRAPRRGSCRNARRAVQAGTRKKATNRCAVVPVVSVRTECPVQSGECWWYLNGNRG